jgi:hypothetical protein
MNTFVASPNLALTIAQQTVDQRVTEAEYRAQARAARSEIRAARRESSRLSGRPTEHYRLPWWAFRFVRPAH